MSSELHDTRPEAQEKLTSNNIKRIYSSVEHFDTMTAKGDFCTMSDIVQFASSMLKITSTFQDRDMKQMIISHYGHWIISLNRCNSRVNRPGLFLSSDLDAADPAIKLRINI